MKNSLVFKYRALEPWAFLLDILVNKRLYAASFQSLNDPMEGAFTYSQDKTSPSFIEQMRGRKARLKICSLSKVYNSTVMWSYYAAAHKGIVIGAEINRNDPDIVEVKGVTYAKNNVFRGFLGNDAETEARKVLAKKLTAWKHEKEIRVFSRTEFVPVTIKKMYLGCQMPDTQKQLIRALMKKLDPLVNVEELCREDLDSNVPENAI